MIVPVKKRSAKQRKRGLLARVKSWPKPLLVALLFGLIGVGYFLYQAFAISNTVNYWGSLTSTNPTARYQLTTGSGTMKFTFSNNSADIIMTVKNSAGTTVGTLKSIGKRDVYLTLSVTSDVYTVTLKTDQPFKGKKGYSLHITYPLTDLNGPSAVISKPLSSEVLTGTVDFTANASDDVGITRVEFYVDGTLLGADTTAGYGVRWDTTGVSNGVHSLDVKSYDGSGNVGKASGVATVNNSVSTTTTSRFPGDPNPLVNKKAYYGLSGQNAASYESTTGKSVSLFRSYASAWPSQDKLVSSVKDAHAKNRLPWISVKTPGWGTLASGSRDGEIDSLLRAIDSTAAGKPVWFTVHHEFEGDSTATGEYTPANFRAMQSKIRQRMTVVGTKNIAFMPIFQGHSWDTHDKWNKDDFYVAGIWDAIGVDHYSHSDGSDLLRDRWYKFVAWAEAKSLPFAIGEYGVRDYGNATQSASELRDFWDWHFTNKKDMIGMSYFDSALNSPAGSWELAGARLNTWLDISKNDTRVQRINDLAR